MWLAKLQRMIEELPDKYLEPKPLDPQDKALLSLDSKPIGQITEEEKRLYGVSRQLYDSLCLEAEANQALHEQGTLHSSDVCRRFHEQMSLKEEELALVISIVLRSLGERLGFEDEYVIDGYDIYIVTKSMTEAQTDIPRLTGEWPERES